MELKQLLLCGSVQEAAQILPDLGLVPGAVDVVFVPLQPHQQQRAEQRDAAQDQRQQHGPAGRLGAQPGHPRHTHAHTQPGEVSGGRVPHPLQQAGPQGENQQGAAQHGEGVQGAGQPRRQAHRGKQRRVQGQAAGGRRPGVGKGHQVGQQHQGGHGVHCVGAHRLRQRLQDWREAEGEGEEDGGALQVGHAGPRLGAGLGLAAQGLVEAVAWQGTDQAGPQQPLRGQQTLQGPNTAALALDLKETWDGI